MTPPLRTSATSAVDPLVPTIRVEEVCYKVDGQRNGQESKFLLHDVSLSILPSEIVGIVGPNGAGKSTLLNLLSGVLAPVQGNIYLDDRPLKSIDLRDLARTISVLPQEFTTIFDYTVDEIILMGRSPFHSGFGWETAEDLEALRRVKNLTDIAELASRSFLSLSTGEKGRVLLARALAQEPRMLLLDEPTDNLDLRHRMSLLDRLVDLNRTNRTTLVIVSHDINLIAEYCPRVVLLDRGRVAGDGPTGEILTEDRIHEVFGIKTKRGLNPVSGALHFFLSPQRDISTTNPHE